MDETCFTAPKEVREREKSSIEDLHIDGSESAVGDGTADSTSEGESLIQVSLEHTAAALMVLSHLA